MHAALSAHVDQGWMSPLPVDSAPTRLPSPQQEPCQSV